ncbi:chemotaxis protein CheA [Aureimonas leprariae]|uniref:Chemotaxis protein CheA n=1 Tax=Plantimonas leprariae TaxID=2615207 RepID=A0A7V7PQJ7_9HYPH|nr:chemotaxis protein CheA [Aureimonas leprariae]KAB0680629.1 chemotaxis protein CheA [Aureimonas leprariae]
MDAMAEIRQTFFEECADGLAELEQGLLHIENGEADSDTVNAVFRAVHSIKGGAGAFNLNDLVHFAHVFETTLDEVRSNRLETTPDVVKVLLRSADVLADLVTAARDGGTANAERTVSVTEELKTYVGAKGGGAPAAGGAPSASIFGDAPSDDGMDGLDFTPVTIDFSDILGGGGAGEGPSYRVVFTPKPELYVKGNETAILIRECLALGQGTVTCDTGGLPSFETLDPEGAYLTWTIDLMTDVEESAIREIFDFAEMDCELTLERAEGGAEDAGAVDAALADLLAQIQSDSVSAGITDDDEPVAAAPPPAPVSIAPPAAEKAEAAPAAAPTKGKAAAANEGGDKAGGAGAPSATIRVDLDRVDRLINLVGELVIHQVMLSQRVAQAGLQRASDVAVGMDELEQLTREIQDSVMAIRAQPVKSVFQKLPRLVREVADLTGKQVKLVTEGEWTEVDKTVIERLSDPLTHMIRNAIDHGVETPEKRLAAGKPEEGTVRVAAMHRSGRIVIEISDDGAGINRQVVRNIAVTKNLIPADATLTDEETDNLIFLPGFSTKEQVSELSGRGVGMDVVKRSVQALGGRVSISSRPGEGSMFTMSLPLTLAVLDGMIVTAGEHTLVVPLTAIIETLKPKSGEVRAFGRDQRVMSVREKFLPLVDVGCQLGYCDTPTDSNEGVAILVETENGMRSALLFDAIQGQRQVVIKSLEANYGHVPGVAAATILGDGRVALILDVDVVAATSRYEQSYSGINLQAAE